MRQQRSVAYFSFVARDHTHLVGRSLTKHALKVTARGHYYAALHSAGAAPSSANSEQREARAPCGIRHSLEDLTMKEMISATMTP